MATQTRDEIKEVLSEIMNVSSSSLSSDEKIEKISDITTVYQRMAKDGITYFVTEKGKTFKKTPSRNKEQLSNVILSRMEKSIAETVFASSDSTKISLAQADTNDELMILFIKNYLLSKEGLSKSEKLKLKGARDQQRFLKEQGGIYSTKEVSDLLNLERQSVTDKRKRNEILAFMAGGKWKYPAFQFDGRNMVKGLSKIIKILCSNEGMFWDACLFLVNKHDGLIEQDGTCLSPLEALKAGKLMKEVESFATLRFEQSAY